MNKRRSGTAIISINEAKRLNQKLIKQLLWKISIFASTYWLSWPISLSTRVTTGIYSYKMICKQLSVKTLWEETQPLLLRTQRFDRGEKSLRIATFRHVIHFRSLIQGTKPIIIEICLYKKTAS